MSITKKVTNVLYHIFWKLRRKCDKIISGNVAEWLKAHDSKSCELARVPEVRILSFPP